MVTLKISGNQTAILEMMNLLDSDFTSRLFVCHCGPGNTHILTCHHKTKAMEEVYGETYEAYNVEYEDGKIKNTTLIHRYSSNITYGCVR